MHFRGRLEADAPDPALEMLEQVKRMPVPVYGLTPQRHLEDWDAFGVGATMHDDELDGCEISVSYTLWRNPHNIDDPANLAQLDDVEREQLDLEMQWERPTWLLERVRRMRYPLLWECVLTSWSREPREHDTVEARLVAHVNHIVMNRFRETRVRGALPGELDSPVDERHVEHGVVLLVDGFKRRGIRIDTDPDVTGVGVDLGDCVVTAVIPRDEARFVELAFEKRRL